MVNAYDVVVLDRDLPGIHGDTICQMITERDERVMVLTPGCCTLTWSCCHTAWPRGRP
jgi:hypothetical protein